MKKIILDLREATDRDTLYDTIADAFGFPDYFGRNLDALYDCLTEISEDTCVGLFLPSETPESDTDDDNPSGTARGLNGMILSGNHESADRGTVFATYIRRLLRTFEDAEEENEHLCVICAPQALGA